MSLSAMFATLFCACEYTFRDGLKAGMMSVTYAESESCERIVLQTGDFVRLIYLDTPAEHIDNGTRDETSQRQHQRVVENFGTTRPVRSLYARYGSPKWSSII